MLAGQAAAAAAVAVKAATVSSSAVPWRALRRETFRTALVADAIPPHPRPPPLSGMQVLRPSPPRAVRHGLGAGCAWGQSLPPPPPAPGRHPALLRHDSGKEATVLVAGRSRAVQTRQADTPVEATPPAALDADVGGGRVRHTGAPPRRAARWGPEVRRGTAALTSRRRPCASAAPRGSRDVLFLGRAGRSVVQTGAWMVGARCAQAADAGPARQLQWPRAAECGRPGAERRPRGTSPPHATRSRSGGRADGQRRRRRSREPGGAVASSAGADAAAAAPAAAASAIGRASRRPAGGQPAVRSRSRRVPPRGCVADGGGGLAVTMVVDLGTPPLGKCGPRPPRAATAATASLLVPILRAQPKGGDGEGGGDPDPAGMRAA